MNRIKGILKVFMVMLLCGITMELSAENRFYIEDFSIEAGKTKDVGIILDNDVEFVAFQSDVILSEGLEFVFNEDEYDYCWYNSDRINYKTFSCTSAFQDEPANKTLRMLVSFTKSGAAISGNSGELMYVRVRAAANFFGSATIKVENVVFTQTDETQYKLESTEAVVTGPEWQEPEGVELTVTSALHGSMIFLVESGKAQSVKLVPDDGYILHSLTFNGEDVKESVVEGYYTTPALTEAATLNIAFEIVVGVDEVVASDRVRVTAVGGRIIVDGTVSGELVNLYTDGGMQLNSVYSNGDRIEFEAIEGKVYIVKTLNRTIKVMM